LNGFKLFQADVEGAFLNAKLDHKLYINIPEGYKKKAKESVAIELDRNLYGTKQGARQWNIALTEILMKELEFEQSDSELCLFRKRKDSRYKGEFILITHVDDILAAVEYTEDWKTFKEAFGRRFRWKDQTTDKVGTFLGMEYEENLQEGYKSISQKGAIEKMLQTYPMSESNIKMQPMEHNPPGRSKMRDENWAKNVPYRNATGELVHRARTSRPDIKFATSYVSRRNQDYSKENWETVKHILAYLKNTTDCKICYKQQGNHDIVGFCDSDWAQDPETRKSITGYIFILAGAPIAWCTRKQDNVSKSSMESEYYAMGEATMEAVYLRRIYEFMKRSAVEKPTTIFCDNQSAMKLADNPIAHRRSKHIDVSYHFVREKIEKKIVQFKKVDTVRNLADGLTKGLGKIKIERMRTWLGVVKSERERRNYLNGTDFTEIPEVRDLPS